MAEVLVDAWLVVACAEQRLTDEEADLVRDHVERELVTAVARLPALLGETVIVRVEQ